MAQDSVAFLVEAPARTLLSSAVEGMIGRVYPGAVVAMETAPPSPTGSSIRITLEGGERWMLLGSGMSARDIAESVADGAWSIVPTDSSQQEFEHGLRAIVEGHTPYLAEALCRRLAIEVAANQMDERSVARLFGAREREIIELVAHGCSNAEIARRLGISVNTVRTHLQSLFSKLQVQTRLRLVARARELGIIDG
jgi:DNA-binding NarL/FixJ family response regulator